MNKLIFSCFISTIILCSCSNYSSKHNIQESIWNRQFYSDSKRIKTEGIFRDSFCFGYVRDFTKYGLVEYEINYDSSGLQNGIVRSYNCRNWGQSYYQSIEGQNYKDNPVGWWRFYDRLGQLVLMMKMDSNSKVVYYARFIEGRFFKDSIGLFDCDTSRLH